MEKHIHIIANTHWDREWLVSRERFLVRLVKLMDRLVPIMEKDKNYTFVTDGQYVFVKDYLDVRPEMKDRVKALIEEGRLLVGPWYTQPLETLITGESMVRNLYYGIRDTSRLGKPMLYSYMVDEFGHASQTPQVLKGFGIDDALAWRGIPNNLPAVFQWNAPSGDGVRMHRSYGYGEATALPKQKEDFVEDVDGVTQPRPGLIKRLENIKNLKERDDNSDVQFWLNGIDHSWAQEDLAEVIDIIREMFPDCRIEQSTLEKYTDDLMEYYNKKGYEMPVWTGELTHPDQDRLICVSSNRPDQKMRHYYAEHVLEKNTEPLAAMAWLKGCEYPLWAIESAWKYILENHAHDSLGCCSIDDVYDAVMERYLQSISLSEQIRDDSIHYLTSTDPDVRSFWVCPTNSCGHTGAFMCEAEIPQRLEDLKNFKIVDENGNRMPIQITDKFVVREGHYNALYGHPNGISSYHYHFAADLGDLKGFTWKKLLVEPAEEEETYEGSGLPENVMENEFLHVTVADNGTVEVLDKRTNRKYSKLLQIADSGDFGDMYIFKPPMMNEIITNSWCNAEITKTADGPLFTEITVKYTMDIPVGVSKDTQMRLAEKAPMDIEAVLCMYRDVPRVDIKLSVTNRSRFHQVRVLFPTQAREAVTSVSGQPFDIVERPIGIPAGFNFARDTNCQYHPMEDFCGAFDKRNGLYIAAKGIFEYECINDDFRTLALTLGRTTDMCGAIPNDDRLKYRTDKSFLLTTLTWDLSIIPLTEDRNAAYKQVLDFVNPPVSVYRRLPDEARLPSYEIPKTSSIAGQTFVELSDDSVYITGMKRADESDMLVFRVLNLADEEKKCRLSTEMLGDNNTYWSLDLMEQKKEMLEKGSGCNIKLRPRQFMTIGVTKE